MSAAALTHTAAQLAANTPSQGMMTVASVIGIACFIFSMLVFRTCKLSWIPAILVSALISGAAAVVIANNSGKITGGFIVIAIGFAVLVLAFVFWPKRVKRR